MTKAEKIEMLEAQLKAARLELEQAYATIGDYKKKEESLVYVELGNCICDCKGYHETLVIHSRSAPYGAGVCDYDEFHRALAQFLAKWNEAVREAGENPYKEALAAALSRAANVPRGEE